MKTSIYEKIATLVDRHQELGALLSQPEMSANPKKFRELSKEYAQLEPIVEAFERYREKEKMYQGNQELLSDEDKEVRAMAQEEALALQKEMNQLERAVIMLLIPKDESDDKNVFLEIRAGTGGDEAAIFVGDLFRMYSRYAEKNGFKIEMVTANPSSHGGFKEIIVKVLGRAAFQQLKFESGVHRVQRVPETESQGRVHTSACTVALLPEVESIDEIQINSDELRIDTYRASGSGGQHVNRTDSAVRITHLPTGTVVECQDERSQHKNKAKAMSLLQAKLLMSEREKQRKEQADTRKSLIGSGDRSERIRTYNYPQGRITDHRINLTVYKLPEVLEGELQEIIQPLIREYQAEQLTALGLNDDSLK